MMKIVNYLLVTTSFLSFMLCLASCTYNLAIESFECQSIYIAPPSDYQPFDTFEMLDFSEIAVEAL